MGGDPPGVNTELTLLFVLEFSHIFFQTHILNFHCQDLIICTFCVYSEIQTYFFCPLMMSNYIMSLNPSHQVLDGDWIRH